MPEANARVNLSKSLSNLRRLFGDYLDIQRTQVGMAAKQPAYALDAAAFEEAAGTAREVNPTAERLHQAIDYYQDDFLAGFNVRGALDFEQWLETERLRLRAMVVQCLFALSQHYEKRHNYPQAIDQLRRLIRHEPWQEDAHRRLMWLLARSGQRTAALAQYSLCKSILADELDVEPSSETTDLYLYLRDGSGQPEVAVPEPSTQLAMVGRQTSWDALQKSWDAVPRTGIQCVILVGEAGIGKTYLAESWLAALHSQGYGTATSRGYPLQGGLLYEPILEWLRSDLFSPIFKHIPEGHRWALAQLLPERVPESPAMLQTGPAIWQRRHVFDALAWMIREPPGPIALLLDDMHWCDNETLDWLQYLTLSHTDARVLLIGTVRTEELHPDHHLHEFWRRLSHERRLRRVELEPLNRVHTATLGTFILGRSLDHAEAEQLFRLTEGVPFFVVEILEAHAGRKPALLADPSLSQRLVPAGLAFLIPPRMYAVIQERLSHLSSDAELVAGLAAAAGQPVSAGLLAHAARLDPDRLNFALDELWRRRVLCEDNGQYAYAHDRIRDVAYAELSPMQRTNYHHRLASTLAESYAADLGPASGRIAAHYEQSGETAQAVYFYELAADRARAMYAYEEMARQLQRARQLLAKLSTDSHSWLRDVRLLEKLGVALVALKGYAARDVLEIYSEAVERFRQASQNVDPPVLRALAVAHVVHNEFDQAAVLGQELLARGSSDNSTLWRVEAHYVLGITNFWIGEFLAGRRHLQTALAMYDPALLDQHLADCGQNPNVTCRSRLAYLLWYLGYADQAAVLADEATKLARQAGQPFGIVYALVWSLFVHSHRGDIDRTRRYADEAVSICTEYGLEMWRAMAAIFQGWAWAETGDVTRGVALMQQSLAALDATGARYALPYLGMLAQWYARAGRLDQAVALVDRGLSVVEERGPHCSTAELLRVSALLRNQVIGADEGVAATLERALSVARSQQARMLELRVLTTMVQLGVMRRAQDRAVAELRAVLAWFTEGTETRDLVDAAALLRDATN
ncbi:MAG: AAA family ATPase [Caldilineaceae bacterium]|nr:AAA family ATPase [Caldilineaceae bacterium]